MVQMIKLVLLLTLLAGLHTRKRDERGEGAVPWLIVLGAGIGIAYFAGDAVWDFARALVGNLG
jgi:hypothetical protein